MPPFLNRLWRSVRATVAPVPDISAELWLQTLQRYPFLARLSLPEQGKLRALSALFLDQKQFHGTHGLEVTEQIKIEAPPNVHNEEYLRTKRDKMGHILHHQGLALDEEMILDEQIHDSEKEESA